MPKQSKNGNERKQLMLILKMVCELQKQYGKTAANLETLVEGFAWLLEEYTSEEITWSMKQYILNNSDIPAPADIKKIIDSKPLDGEALIIQKMGCYNFRRRQGLFLSPHEAVYLLEYEKKKGTVWWQNYDEWRKGQGASE